MVHLALADTSTTTLQLCCLPRTPEFSRPTQLGPTYPAAHANLGMMLARTGNPGAAIAPLKKVVELKPDDAEARRNLGHALAEKGDFKEAVVQLEKADQLANGQDALTLHLLSKVSAYLGKAA